ncbi:MAG: fucose isomerase, partial [Clostridia bacterium]|nr:fucose isomerase [Clostridia bacterium]
PPNFYTVIMNEQELLSRWGVEMVPITAHRFVAEVKRMALEDSRIDAETALIARRVDVGATPVEALRKIAAMKLFMLDWAARDGLSAIAIRCHEDIPDALECYSCFANAEVTAAGIPVTCETDIHGALSALLLQHAQMAFDPVFFADITIRHPVNDNGVLLWHCGNFPASLCKADAACALKGHCNIPPGLPGTGNHEIEAGEITVCRFDGMNGEYRLFVGEGVSIQGPYVRGTYAWMEVDDWVRWERKLIYGPYIHHVAGARGRSAAALIEACRYIPGLSAETA